MPIDSARVPVLAAGLEALIAATDAEARLATDPVGFARRWPRPEDAEVAGLFAALLAYGRVAPVRHALASLGRRMEAAGGPRAWVETFDPRTDTPGLAGAAHRWTRPAHLAALALAIRGVLAEHGSLEACFAAGPAPSGNPGPALESFVAALRRHLLVAAPAVGLPRGGWGDQPLGVRHLLPAPSGGSACKRPVLFLRWMARPDDGVDLGLWRIPAPAELVVPLDVHVLRLARRLGLTAHRSATWAAALDVTRSLVILDPVDPVRFDFALAHLGISGTCTGRPGDCGACALAAACLLAPR